jgi:hypothetical protein
MSDAALEQLRTAATAFDVPRCITILCENKGHDPLQEAGCALLHNWTKRGEEVCKSIADAGAVCALLDAMDFCAMNRLICGDGCGALENLATHPEICVEIGREGGISVLLNIMRSHPVGSCSKSRIDVFAWHSLHNQSPGCLFYAS